MLEKLLLALIVTLCLNLLVVVRLSNRPNSPTGSRTTEQIATREKLRVPIGRNWQQYQMSPIVTK